MSRGLVTRRLAAILAADVIGYGRLMGKDKIGTLDALKRHRKELIDPVIGARFVALEGKNHLMLEHEPAWTQFLSEVRDFLSEAA